MNADGDRDWRWRDVVVVHRLEYPFTINYLCYAIWGACYGLDENHQLVAVPTLLAALANLLLTVAGLALNTAADIRTDERSRGKHHRARAALRVGHDRTLRWAAKEMAAGLMLAVVAAAWSGQWPVALAAVLAAGLSAAYNLEPVRLKRRGMVGPVAVGLSLVSLPCLVSYGAVRADLDWPVLLVFLGLGILATGRTLWWSVPDRAGDTVTGMRTPTVRYGTVPVLVLSVLVVVLGLILLAWGLWWRFGVVLALLGAAGSGVFVAGMLLRLRQVAAGHTPNVDRMRRVDMSLAMASNVLIALIPIIGR